MIPRALWHYVVKGKRWGRWPELRLSPKCLGIWGNVFSPINNREGRKCMYFGLSSGGFPHLHLGLSLSLGALRCADWLPIIKRYESTLAGWTARFLSYGDRLVLCRSVLVCLCIFLLCFGSPSLWRRRLSPFRRCFFGMGVGGHNKGWHDINWGRVAASNDQGGLGIKNVRDFNLTLV